MLIILSPSKTMDSVETLSTVATTEPKYSKQAKHLISLLKAMSVNDLMTFMKISENIAIQNLDRYRNFGKSKLSHPTPAVLSYTGEVYNGLSANVWTNDDLMYAQDRLRIFSGLYGSLKPMDLIYPYRLEMAAKLSTEKGSNLYHFWKEDITKSINEDLKKLGQNTLINLASDEYFKVLDTKKIKANIISLEFYELRAGKRKFVSFSAKRARGLMAGFIIKNRINDVQKIKDFNDEGYYIDEDSSTDNHFVFIKPV